MIDIALKNFSVEDQKTFFNRQAEGVFFHSPPMCWYGSSPVGYACSFGLRAFVRKLLDTGLVSLNENCGKIVGFYPIHAVAANGNRTMYDFLVKELPEGQRKKSRRPTHDALVPMARTPLDADVSYPHPPRAPRAHQLRQARTSSS